MGPSRREGPAVARRYEGPLVSERPIVGLATTELPTVIVNGENGYVATDVDMLIEQMRSLLADPAHARQLGEGARRTALERFGIERFKRDWDNLLSEVAS